jgi:hypothetical protein
MAPEDAAHSARHSPTTSSRSRALVVPTALRSPTIPSPELEDVVLVLLIPNLLVLVPQLSLRARNLSLAVSLLEERTLSGIPIEVREPSVSANSLFVSPTHRLLSFKERGEQTSSAAAQPKPSKPVKNCVPAIPNA